MVEKLELDPSRLPRHDGHIHCLVNPICIRKYLRRPRRQYAADQLPRLSLHCRARRRASLLAPAV
jgi:hypothetical protein